MKPKWDRTSRNGPEPPLRWDKPPSKRQAGVALGASWTPLVTWLAPDMVSNPCRLRAVGRGRGRLVASCPSPDADGTDPPPPVGNTHPSLLLAPVQRYGSPALKVPPL